MRRAVLSALLLAGAAASEGAPPAAVGERVSESIIQIGLINRAPSAVLRPEGGFSVFDQVSGQSRTLPKGADLEIRADGERRVHMGDLVFSGAARLMPASPADAVLLGSRRYRGSFLLKPNDDSTITIVNELGIEEYLYGVLAKEMLPSWPMEALKAQAVVARTFALNNLGKFSELGFDLSDDARSQAYSGLDGESDLAREAVRSTSGQVLSWRGQRLEAYFHSCCGGHTASVNAIWGGAQAPRPLRGVSDRYCKVSPQFRWSAFLSEEDLLDVLRGHLGPLESLQGVRLGSRDASGYLRDIRIAADSKSFRVRANDFRNWVGASRLRSTQVWRILRRAAPAAGPSAAGTAREENGRRAGFLFVGRGFGHGVGLCQWGAKEQAERGRDYRRILSFYFPGAEVLVPEE